MRLLVGWTRALEDVRQFDSQPSGNVSLAMPPSISRMVGVALVQAVIAEAPQVSLKLVEALSGSIRPGLEAGTIDLGILHDNGTLRYMSKRKFAQEEMFLIAPPGQFGTSREDIPTIRPEEIVNFPLIMPGLEHGTRSFLDREAQKRGFSLSIIHEIDAINHIVSLVSGGFGYSILPLPSVSVELADGKVSIARLGAGTLSRSLCVVRNSSLVITHASVVVEDILLGILDKQVLAGEWGATLEERFT